MVNAKSNKQQNRKIELTENQQNPYLAKPEDFEVEKPNGPAEIGVPGHGQRGVNEREEKQLLVERRATGKGATLPLEPGEAKAPHQK